jgi:hypothetical protein
MKNDIVSKDSQHPAAKVYRFDANPEGMKVGQSTG